MKYCRQCGKELLDEAVICPQCGCATGHQAASDEKASALWIIIAILFPIVGAIYALIEWKNKPNAAKTVLIVSIIVWVLSMIAIGAMQSAMVSMQ